ncbi:peptidase S8/S53 domain-containing protein [Infundibulicybe gibba]|nr:peptidase S8/S53 domain-containing protein [Infundibulicybe gibba]
MTALTQWSLLAIFLASVHATPLSTNAHNPPTQRSPLALAPFLVTEHPHGTINNSYIVILKQDLPDRLKENHFNFLQMAHSTDPLVGDDLAGIRQVYDGHFKGYAGRFTEGVVQQLRGMPEVEYIERDQIVRTMETQRGAPWGLARISHRPKLTFGTFSNTSMIEWREGVDVYVGRASWGKTIPDDIDEDANGHGSHCAGTIASRKYGVAKKANVIAVKWSMSDVVGGAKEKADAAAAEIAATGNSKHKGGGKSRALDDAVNRAVDSGLHFAVAAVGNDNRDASVTVGASTLGDERAYFSNHGSCVDLFAPGRPTATNTLSGTSMASPHTAGLLAYLLSIYPSAQFDPVVYDLIPQTNLQIQSAFVASSHVYAVAHAALPAWVSAFLPPPKLVDTMTIPLKEVLIKQLSTPNVLRDLPSNTVNLLIFNNATSY